MSHRLAALALLVTTTACTIHLPAPKAPERRKPDVALPAEPPVAGMGRVVFDTPGRETRVRRITAQAAGAADTGPSAYTAMQHVCTTPCTVDLPRGEYRMSFVEVDGGGVGEAYVAVGERPRVVAGALGKREGLGGWAFLGGTLVVGGVVSAGIGAAMNATEEDGTKPFFYGIGALFVGALMMAADQREVQPATFDQYDLD